MFKRRSKKKKKQSSEQKEQESWTTTRQRQLSTKNPKRNLKESHQHQEQKVKVDGWETTLMWEWKKQHIWKQFRTVSSRRNVVCEMKNGVGEMKTRRTTKQNNKEWKMNTTWNDVRSQTSKNVNNTDLCCCLHQKEKQQEEEEDKNKQRSLNGMKHSKENKEVQCFGMRSWKVHFGTFNNKKWKTRMFGNKHNNMNLLVRKKTCRTQMSVEHNQEQQQKTNTNNTEHKNNNMFNKQTVFIPSETHKDIELSQM